MVAAVVGVPLGVQAFDQGGRARAFSALVNAMAQAKEAGIDPAPLFKQLDMD